MNSTNLDCLVSSYEHRRPSLYDSRSFFYVGKLVIAISCASSPVSAIGNGLVLLAIIRTTFLRTPDNVLVGTLAVADCLIGAVIQPMLITMTIKTSLLLNCPFLTVYTLFSFICSSSVSLMAAVSGERCIALFLPLRYNSLVTNTRAFLVAFIIWLAWVVAAICSCFGGVIFKMGHIFAGVIWSASCIIIGASYIKICLLVRYHHRQIHSQQAATSNTQNTNTASQAKLAVTMGYVIGISLLCYLPTTLVAQLFLTSKRPGVALFNVFSVLLAFQLMSSCFNPIIYCWRRRDIRKATVNQLRRFCQWIGLPASDEIQPFEFSQQNLNTSAVMKPQSSLYEGNHEAQ